MSVARKFKFGERWSTDLRAEFFNIMNHANPNGPAAGLTSSTFGQITSFQNSTTGGLAPRLIQLGLKVYF
jgi:hypothetical protein